ncbi:hypothetical protein [Metapseudomonas otitidis]|uniref:hypothetical protein n=1 Tax=Metapseudomonas otitidis TaxID=319939 RepID=UPI00244808AC|nr:hypothetical protein [Pseudomonas otitidis]MDH0335662.1 hypothetical protein [Pseudomonas otitidis]
MPRTSLRSALIAMAVGQAQAADCSGVENTRTFLEALQKGCCKPLETLSPQGARAVLVGAQNSVKVELAGIKVEKKIIQAGGQPIS